jgi:hypothetical protein
MRGAVTNLSRFVGKDLLGKVAEFAQIITFAKVSNFANKPSDGSIYQDMATPKSTHEMTDDSNPNTKKKTSVSGRKKQGPSTQRATTK